jgi:hypothetical protein
VRRRIEARDVADLLSVGRPGRAVHDRALGRLDRSHGAGVRVEKREANAATRRQHSRAVRFGIDLESTQSVVEFSERLDRRQAFALGLEEVASVRAGIRERDVVSRRRHESLDDLRRLDVRLFRQDFFRIPPLLHDRLRGERQTDDGETGQADQETRGGAPRWER